MRRRFSVLAMAAVFGLSLGVPVNSASAAAPVTAPAPGQAALGTTARTPTADPAPTPGPATAPARSAGSPASPGSQGATRRVERACPDNGPRLTCHAVRQVDPAPPSVAPNASTATPAAVPAGYGPADLRSAYNLTSTGSGAMTVAIVDAYDGPTAESDLAQYRSTYGLPPCTTANGCFRKVNQSGQVSPLPKADPGWASEIALDLAMVSATCPNCRILLVEANSPTIGNLGTAVNTAVRLGAKFVSNSYGGPEDGSENSYDASYYNHPGVVVTASTGDNGYAAGVSYPASGKGVTAVGGTSLFRSNTPRGWSESAWSGAGSGCSISVAKPAFQSGLATGCGNRAEADVSAVADPQTGVAVYQTYGAPTSGWQVYGGTSAAAPIIASIYALAGNPGSADSPNAYPYARRGSLNDVTSGSNGPCTPAPTVLCTAGPGYDGPTGLGTPIGTGAFSSSSSPIVTHYNALGGSGSYLGSPVGGEYAVAGGQGQNYTGGAIYYSPGTGAWAVHGAILGSYQYLGGPAGSLGFPTTDETGTPDGVGRYNHFAGTGTSGIYWTPSTGAHAVLGAIYGKWASLGWEGGPLGYPTTDEIGTADGVGRYNRFTGAGASAVYWTPGTGAHSVRGAIYSVWAGLGLERGPLGYPTTDETGTPDGIGSYNHFTGTGMSSVHWSPSTGAHAVYGAIYGRWASLGWEGGSLGYPTTDEYAIGGGRRSNFVRGYVSWDAGTGATSVTYF